jgi:uncharacterized protein YndB with AHSA1/START domain
VGELVKEIWIAAPPERVFPYIVEADLLSRWIGDESWNDPRPGGVFRLRFGETIVRGEFVEVDPPRRVVFTWGHEEAERSLPAGSTTVEVDLEQHDGGTRVRLRHSGLPNAEEVERHNEGWDRYLPELAREAS